MTATTHAALPASMLTSAEQRSAARQLTPVSYTHLTLPTILLV